MQSSRPLSVWIIFFIVLNLYTNFTPRFFGQQDIANWALYWTGFFLIAYLIGRFALKLNGLKSFGLNFHNRWALNVFTGFLAGAFIYALKYLIFYELNRFEVIRLMTSEYILGMLSQAFIAMFFSSLMNDILVKGYWLPYFNQRKVMKWFILATTLIYTSDDLWNEGLDPMNMLFSAVLGVSLAYTVLKTGSVWLSFGIHWGGNMVYRALYGFTGQGIWETQTLSDSIAFDWISIGVTALLFPLVYILVRMRLVGADHSIQTQQPEKVTTTNSPSFFPARSNTQ